MWLAFGMLRRFVGEGRLTFAAWVYARDPFRAGQTIYDASDSVDGAALNASVINVGLGYNGERSWVYVLC